MTESFLNALKMNLILPFVLLSKIRHHCSAGTQIDRLPLDEGLIWGPVIKLSTISNSENIDFTIESELN